ncbi:MAG: protoporphyrinogen/coproporphyrinogen oxidase [Pseudonocardiales bacterium]|jgi:oxygen-dependent protoporphyrinogen oxidase|nr:protoporphyrinogen/coproporphyrinogen oxidase [Pseudonocardiales bacterium]
MPRVAVIGGGIAGLSAANEISRARPDVEVVLLEGADRVGGKLRRAQVAGVWVDVGAEAMLARRPEGVRAATEAGLASALISPLSTSALLRSRGANHSMPARTLIGVPSDVAAVRASGVLSAQALARIEDEPAAGPYPPVTGDVSVGDLVGQRFGAEVVDRLVDPLLGGVYAGQARQLSLQAAMPALASRLMSHGGSLLAAAAAAVGPPISGQVFASLSGGLARLAERLAAADSFEVRTSTPVRELRRTATGFELAVGSVPSGQLLSTDAVVVAVPAGKAGALLAELAPAAAAELNSIETASMVIVTLAFARLPPHSLPPGSGVLVPAVEGLAVKAITFSSQKWPGIGSESGVVLLRASLGRAGEEWALQRTDAELVAVVRRELAEITGVAAEPVDSHVQRWGGALPQYAVGHLQRVVRIRAEVRRIPGLAVCGASYDGVGIPACIGSAHIAASRVLAGLRPAGQ